LVNAAPVGAGLIWGRCAEQAIDGQDVFMTAPELCRRSILVLAAVALATGTAPAFAAADNAAVAPVRQLVDGLTRVMKAGRAVPFERRFDMLAPVIDQTIDLSTILKASVGASWDNLPPDQQATLMKSFRRYTVASYINGFDADDEHFDISPEPRVSGDEQVVRIRIVQDNGEEHRLDHVMRRGPAGWRIVDVLADGAISRVAVQRSDFRQLMRQGGAAALAKSLDSKSADLAG
jgi:phospholipid transport system substrate-binding protein